MTLINDLLKRIKEAIYGEEVRGSIHDAIEQCYKDAVGHPESVAATVKEIGEVSANLSKETADRKAEVGIERKRIDNLVKDTTDNVVEYKADNFLMSCKSDAQASTTETALNVFKNISSKSENLGNFITISSNSKIQIKKSGLYSFDCKVQVTGVNASTGRQYARLKINDVQKNEYMISLIGETDEEFTNFIVSLNEGDTISFTGESDFDDTWITLYTTIHILDYDGKVKIPDITKEVSDIRVGEDGTVYGTAGEAVRKQIGNLTEDLDNKIEHVGGYKEYDIGTPSVGTYWNKSAKKQLESETYQSFNPISLKAGTYHYENMSGSFTFYEDTDGNWIPIGKYSTSGNGDVVITNDTTMYITEMQKSGVFVGAKLYSGDITQKESNWFKNPKYDIDNINNTLESLSDSVNDIKSIDGSVIKEYCIYVSTTGSDTSGDGSEEKPFATIYHANETITDNSYAKRYRIIVLPGTYTDLQDKYTGIAQTSKYQGVITKPWVTYESKSGNPEDTIIEWNGSTGLENPIRSDIVEKCAFHIVSLPRTFTAIKGFTIKSKNTRYAMHCESSGMGIQGEWLIENCIFDWGGCPNISDDTGRFPAIGIGMSPCEKGTIKFCKIVTTTVETMLVHDGKNKDGNSAVILGAELNFIKCDLGTGRLQFQSIYPKSGEINAKTNNVCNLISCTQINNLYSYISSLNSDDEMVWRVYGKDCDFASYGNMSDYVYKIGTANNVSN